MVLLIAAAATVAVVHSILPDHWVPIAVVARTQNWSLLRVARISGLAAAGHVIASLVLAGVIALVGLRFEQQINTQQGHIVGGVLVLTGMGFLAWGLTGHGHAHAHDHDDNADLYQHEDELHDHEHPGTAVHDGDEDHEHQHQHAGVVHTHAHRHEAFIRHRADLLARRSQAPTPAARLAAIAVPFGVAASPDLTILPVALAASAYGSGAVTAVLGVFAIVTMAAFVGLTVVAAAAGYQVKGLWLEEHANTITSLVLIAIGVVAFFGF